MSITTPAAIIADDEPRLRTLLVKQLALLWPELKILAEADNGQEALAAIEAHKPDLVFLDIRMPAPNGLEVAAQLLQTPKAPLVVFVTAHDEHALQAFDQAALDYVLKPVQPDRLKRTVTKLQKALVSNTPAIDTAALNQLFSQLAPATETSHKLRWLKASKRGSEGEEIELISIKDILVFEAADKYLRVLHTKGEAWVRLSIRELLDRLDPHEFWQIHRGTVVRVEAIAASTRSLSGKLTVRVHGVHETFEVSRSFSGLFKAD
jgi:DNA-binding LytR/AlgR family response regulator